MSYLIEKKKGKLVAVEAKIAQPEKLSAVLSPLRWKILNELAKKPAYPSGLAEEMKLNEQKVFYHINQLRKAGLVEVERREEKRGGVAKYYRATSYAFGLKLPSAKDVEFDFDVSKKKIEGFLERFVDNGKFDFVIVVGSPDPHGPEKARARDGHYATILGMFLAGIASCEKVSVKTDTEIRSSDRLRNLILIGGPKTNRLVGEINPYLPVRFEQEKGWDVYSESSGETFGEERTGMVVETESPWNSDKRILVLAGKHQSGTKAAVLAFTRNFDSLRKEGNFAKVVEGVDVDGDGFIDETEVRE